MNFYPSPPIIKAEVHVRVPDHLRCTRDTEWRGGSTKTFKNIFLEGPVADDAGNLYVVDVPYGRILRIGPSKDITVSGEWDGEPNGLVGTTDGKLIVADYKQVRRGASGRNGAAGGARLTLCFPVFFYAGHFGI